MDNKDIANLNTEGKIEVFLRLPPIDNEESADITREYISILRLLRDGCAHSKDHQNAIAEHEELNNQLHQLVFAATATPENVRLIALQLLANATVQNTYTQCMIWQRHGAEILRNCSLPPLGKLTDVCLMIVYIALKGAAVVNIKQQALCAAVHVWQTMVQNSSKVHMEMLHFLFEYFIVHGENQPVPYYASLTTAERITFLDYLKQYLVDNCPNGRIHEYMLKHITYEFTIKSDNILICKQDSAQFATTDPLLAHEVQSLLRVIAYATGTDEYGDSYANEHSLFLNVSSLLRLLAQVGKESQNIFTPMNKLEEVALTSKIPRDFESEVSFEFKTLLVRCIANLLYKNKTNQGYCIDTRLLPTLLECTNMDARNPLLREWSILAIRNACEGNRDVQELIANMTNEGPAKNDIMSELNLGMGSLRIKPNTK
uniref:Ataxin-10 n=1 Tax=Ceratitis capitata TaxID=7213 RepID=W8BIA9_CERCA